MCKVFLYSRVSTSQQTLAQQERAAYEWLKAHNMKVDEVVSDEGISGGVSYADRNLGKVLLPMMNEGDMIIVSEISRLGRSMFNLSELIHKELKPRKIRLVCVNMGIDLDCSKMTAIDELIISNFSFAAQLEKQLISERTLSALAIRKKQGVLLGGANPKHKASRKAKTYEQREIEDMKKGITKTKRYLESRDVQAFLKVLQRCFPESAVGEPVDWDWNGFTTRMPFRVQVLTLMKDLKDMDYEKKLFIGWDFSDIEGTPLQVKLASFISNLRRSYATFRRQRELQLV